jgi:hypothetical protein
VTAAAACRLLQGWAGWVCYNDDPPAGSAGRGGMTFGHCKGILAWSRDRLGWLVHSVPCWPAAFNDAAVSPLVSSGLRCGQSFLWLTMARTPELTREISGAPCRAGCSLWGSDCRGDTAAGARQRGGTQHITPMPAGIKVSAPAAPAFAPCCCVRRPGEDDECLHLCWAHHSRRGAASGLCARQVGRRQRRGPVGRGISGGRRQRCWVACLSPPPPCPLACR